MTSSRSKRVVYVAGAILAAVLVGFLFSSGLLITQYHVLLLQHNESYLEELLRGDPHELERAAIQKYLRGKEGREHIVELFLETVQEKTRHLSSRFKGQPRFRQPAISCVLVVENSYLVGFQFPIGGDEAAAGALRGGEDDRLIRAITPYLHSLSAETFTFEESPGLEIALLPGDKVCSEAGVYCRLEDGEIRETVITKQPNRPDWFTDNDVKKLAKGVGLVLRRVAGDMTVSEHRQ